MVTTRDSSVVEAMEPPSTSKDGVPFSRPDAGIPGSSDSSQVDLIANRSDPPNPPDLCVSDRTNSPPRPTAPVLQPMDGDDGLIASSDTGRGEEDGGDAAVTVVGDHHGPPPQLDKAHDPTEPAIDGGRLETSTCLIEAGVAEDDPEVSGPASDSESQDASYPSSVFEEADDCDSAATSTLTGTSRKQKQKQKADPEAETSTLSETSDGDDDDFQPLSPGDPGWEKSTGKPPQKLPIRFRDAVGRNFLFPWEKAKTWTGMKKLVENCFKYIDVLGPHVVAGRYDLSVNLPFSMDPINDDPSLSPSPAPVIVQAPGISSSLAAGTSSALAGPSSSSSSSQQQQDKSSFVVLPELWEDTIEPGMVVVQHMWPFQTPTFVPQPAQPSVSPPPLPGVIGQGRGGGGARGRGRGAGTGAFGGGRGVAGAVFGGLQPGHPGAPMPARLRTPKVTRGKTMRRP
ncbi:hypothetical protein GGR51DRAFT_573813 [Nemania sp. FL0031]|nr:hypothetical protein GGR51DRAFT_573813 [Nemania sp. FL0031]